MLVVIMRGSIKRRRLRGHDPLPPPQDWTTFRNHSKSWVATYYFYSQNHAKFNEKWKSGKNDPWTLWKPRNVPNHHWNMHCPSTCRRNYESPLKKFLSRIWPHKSGILKVSTLSFHVNLYFIRQYFSLSNMFIHVFYLYFQLEDGWPLHSVPGERSDKTVT
jgi:hypothetical protein